MYLFFLFHFISKQSFLSCAIDADYMLSGFQFGDQMATTTKWLMWYYKEVYALLLPQSPPLGGLWGRKRENPLKITFLPLASFFLSERKPWQCVGLYRQQRMLKEPAKWSESCEIVEVFRFFFHIFFPSCATWSRTLGGWTLDNAKEHRHNLPSIIIEKKNTWNVIPNSPPFIHKCL